MLETVDNSGRALDVATAAASLFLSSNASKGASFVMPWRRCLLDLVREWELKVAWTRSGPIYRSYFHHEWMPGSVLVNLVSAFGVSEKDLPLLFCMVWREGLGASAAEEAAALLSTTYAASSVAQMAASITVTVQELMAADARYPVLLQFCLENFGMSLQETADMLPSLQMESGASLQMRCLPGKDGTLGAVRNVVLFFVRKIEDPASRDAFLLCFARMMMPGCHVAIRPGLRYPSRAPLSLFQPIYM